MNWLEVAKATFLEGKRDYYFFPLSFQMRKEVRNFLEIMGNNEPGFVTVFNRDELVLAILFYNEWLRGNG